MRRLSSELRDVRRREWAAAFFFFVVVLIGESAVGVPPLLGWPAAAASVAGLVLGLPWYRELVQQRSIAARRRAAEAAARARLLAKKCCRNCGTEFAGMPGGSRSEFKCTACGLTSRKPKLLIPGEPDGESPPSDSGRAEGRVGAKAAEKKREEPPRAASKARSLQRAGPAWPD